MNRQAMREKVLGEMVVARDLEIERLNAALAAVKQLNRHQGEKILELLCGNEEALRRIVDISKCLS